MTESLPFVRGSDTSRDAAVEKQKQGVLNDEERILRIVHEHGADGCTNDELKVILRDETSGPTARVKSLIDRGFLRDSGLRRRSRSERWQRVVVLGKDPNPIRGEAQDRQLRRPDTASIARALKEIRRLWREGHTQDEDVKALGVWIADLVTRETGEPANRKVSEQHG